MKEILLPLYISLRHPQANEISSSYGSKSQHTLHITQVYTFQRYYQVSYPPFPLTNFDRRNPRNHQKKKNWPTILYFSCLHLSEKKSLVFHSFLQSLQSLRKRRNFSFSLTATTAPLFWGLSILVFNTAASQPSVPGRDNEPKLE